HLVAERVRRAGELSYELRVLRIRAVEDRERLLAGPHVGHVEPPTDLHELHAVAVSVQVMVRDEPRVPGLTLGLHRPHIGQRPHPALQGHSMRSPASITAGRTSINEVASPGFPTRDGAAAPRCPRIPTWDGTAAPRCPLPPGGGG